MKLNINIDAEAKEPEIMITTAQMTEEVNRVVAVSYTHLTLPTNSRV